MNKSNVITRLSFILIAVFLIMLVIVPSCAKPAPAPAPTPAPKVKPIELKFAHTIPPTHWRPEKIWGSWTATIQERTGGKVEFTMYPASSLLKGGEMIDGIISGSTEIGEWSTFHNAGRFPTWEVLNGPGIGLRSMETDSKMVWNIYNTFPEAKAEFDDVKLLGMWTIKSNCLWSLEPIRTLEDIKGKKIRASAGAMAAGIEALGAVPQQVGYNDIYDALDKGVIDGAATNMQGPMPRRWYEVCKYVTKIDCGNVIQLVAMNWDVWNGLPDDVKKTFEEYSGEWIVDACGRNGDEYEAYAEGISVENGVQIIELEPAELAKWAEILKEIPFQVAAKADANGIRGTEVIEEAFKFLGS